MTTLWTKRTWDFPRRMLGDLIGLTLLSWAGFVVVIAAIIAGIAIFDTVDESVWESVAGAPPWYTAFIGGYVFHDLLPLYVAHGQTRRDFAVQATIFTVIFAAAAAVLMAVGFLLERVLYRVADWPQALSGDQLYSSPTDVPLILVEFWLVFLVWTAAGALIGAGFYRSNETGLFTLLPATVVIAAIGIAVGSDWGPFGALIDRVVDEPGNLPLAASIAIGLGAFALTLATTWPLVRDIPIRTKQS
ncbi:MAG: hypothetical protein ACRDJW_20680 [Thermomicrobiales bacterium]